MLSDYERSDKSVFAARSQVECLELEQKGIIVEFISVRKTSTTWNEKNGHELSWWPRAWNNNFIRYIYFCFASLAPFTLHNEFTDQTLRDPVANFLRRCYVQFGNKYFYDVGV